MVQQLVESQGDGWTHATDELEPLLRAVVDGLQPPVTDSRRALHGAGRRPASPGAVAEVHEAVHRQLRTSSGGGRRRCTWRWRPTPATPAFAPEPFTKDDLAALSSEAAALAQRACQALEAGCSRREDSRTRRRRPRMSPISARRAGCGSTRLADRADPVRAGDSSSSASKIRVHGDYHLGQVLWAEGDFYLLDFEGEPARPIAQRRQKQSPLKDVAGMLRSFSYAAYAGLFAHAAGQTGGVRAARAVGATSGRPGPRRPSCAAISRPPATRSSCRPTAAQRDALLRLFMLDKALYELNYELNNRPDWVRIPLWGIFDLLGDTGHR